MKYKAVALWLYIGFMLCVERPLFSQTQSSEADKLYEKGQSSFNNFIQTYDERSYRQSLSFYEQAIRIYNQQNILNLKLGDSHTQRGILFHIQGENDAALKEYLDAINIKSQLSNQVDSIYFLELILSGNLYYNNDQYDSAKYYYDLAEKINLRFENLYERKRLYNSLGAYYFSIGNHQQAIIHHQKALSSLESKDPDFDRDQYLLQSNIALSQVKLGNYKEGINTYYKIIDRTQEHNSLFYENLGFAYHSTHQYDSALFFLKKALLQAKITDSITIFNTMGNVFAQSGALDSAYQYFQKSLRINQRHTNFKNSNYVNSYLGFAKIKFLADLDSVLFYYQQALIANDLTFNDNNPLINPEHISTAISPLHLFTILRSKAHTFHSLFSNEGNINHLILSLQNYQQAIGVAQYIQKTYDNDEAKLFLLQNIYPIYEEAISTAHQLFTLTGDHQYIEIAFQCSEYSKAAVLSEILKDVNIKSRLTTSDSLIREEKTHKQQIAKLRLELIELQDSSKITELQNKLIDSEIALSRTVKLLQKDEKFYKLKYQQDTIDVPHIQNILLNSKDALLEYFLGQDSLYSFLLTQEEFFIESQPLDSLFYQNISDIQAQLYDYQMGQAFEQNQQAYALYQMLMAPFIKVLNQKERLIIVPDGQLNYIPFEMLNDDPSTNHYLIYNHAFSYAYSANLLEEAVSTRRAKESNQVLAMAPFAGDEEGNIRSNGFSLLFGSKEEVENIGGSIYLENQATKRLFLELVSSYGIIHLATHASISNEDPLQSFIAFYPNEDGSSAGYRLYTQELYNLRLDSVKLVVLSACEAGNGQLVKGEGIISLARAFAYAGCPNIITTLWKAQDKSTAIIASNIHKYLKEGYTKDQALRQAKLDYLQAKDVHHLLKTPYYWANFIFIGDAVPIYESSRLWLWWVLAGIIFSAVLYFLIKKFILKS